MRHLGYKISKVNTILLVTLFLIICSSFPIFYSINGVVDAFSFWHMAFVQKFAFSSHFPLEDVTYSPKYIPGAIYTYMILHKVTAIPVKQLHFFPFIGLILPLSYYSLCKKFSNSKACIFIVVLLMLNTPTPNEFFTMWPHAFGFFLFISFIHIFFKVFNNKTPEGILTLVLIFVSVHFYSYTAEMWLLSFFTFILLILLAFSLVSRTDLIKKKMMLSLFVAFISIFLGFNRIFYEAYLPTGRFISTILESSERFLYNYGKFFSLSESNKYIYRMEPNIYLSLSGMLFLSLMILIILYSVLQSLLTLKRSDNLKNIIAQANTYVYFKYALIATGVCDILVYAARGVLTLRYIYFIFPLIVLITLNELPLKKKYSFSILFILLFCALSHSILSWNSDALTSNPTQYKNFEMSANWFMENADQKKALTDLLTGNKYLLEGVIKGQRFDKIFINLDQYDMIVNPQDYGNNKLNNYAPYLIINKNLKKVLSDKWGTYELSDHLNEINRNSNINKIYDDNIIFIFKT